VFFFCFLYIDDSLLNLSISGFGRYAGKHFMEALVYVDDNVLIASTTIALQKVLDICGDYATEYCISFIAAITKCLVVLPKSQRDLHTGLMGCVILINISPIEIVNSFTHLGHVFTSQLHDGLDVANRRAAFIGQVNNMLSFFRNLPSYVKFKLFCLYCTSFHNCVLWSLISSCIKDRCTAWINRYA